MAMIRVVCNSSPIIGFSIINKLELVWELFDEVYITNAVYEEIVNSNGSKSFGIDDLIFAVQNNNIRIYNLSFAS